MLALAIDFSGRAWSPDDGARLRSAICQGIGGEPWIMADGPVLAATRSSAAARAGHSIGEGSASFALFDGELHDRHDLRHAFGRSGRRDSDADLYRRAFDKLGPDCDAKMNGRYSAIVWNSHARRLHCAASPIEAQPLFWGRRGTVLVAASTPHALFALGFVRQLDETKLDAALSGTGNTVDRSWFAGIGRLPPGHSLRLGESSAEMREFWSMAAIEQRFDVGDDEAVERTEALLREGLDAVLDARKQPAISLSGGLDSQIVAAQLAGTTSKDIAAYCSVPISGFSETPRARSFADEGPFAEALGQMHSNLRVETVDAPDAHFTDDLLSVFQLGGIPPRNALNLPWLNAVMMQARSGGADVLLNGGFGNLTFSHDGLDGFSAWSRSGQLRRSVREALAMQDDRSGWRKILAFAVKPLLPRPALQTIAAKRAFGSAVDPQLSLHERAGVPTRADRMHFAELAMAEGSEIDAALELRHGIALRDPTTYRPFVEWCLSLPPEQFLRGGQTRFLARRLGAGKIPERVRLERRTGLQAADWPIRMRRRRDELVAELRRVDADERLAHKLDTRGLIAELQAWDGEDRRGSGAIQTIAGDVPRAVVLGRFVRFVEGERQ